MPDPNIAGQVDDPDEVSVEFLVRFTRAGHEAGYPTADLEDRVLVVAGSLGIHGAQISVTPTMVDVSFGSPSLQRGFTLRVRPTGVDLDAIARLDALVRDLADGRTSPDAGLERLEDIIAHPLERPWFVRLVAYGVAGAAVTPVLGGGWRDVIAGGLVGLLVGVIVLSAGRFVRTEPMIAPVAAVGASFSAAALFHLGVRISPDVVTLAALVTLLPGMALAIGMRELATEHLQSGVANTANALVQLLGLVFGVGVGRSIAASWFGVTHQPSPVSAFSGTYVVAAAAAGLAFTVTLRAPSKVAPVMCSATVLAIVANAAGKAVFGATAGVFVASLTIGIAGGLGSVPLRISPLVIIVPGVLMLVPGSVGSAASCSFSQVRRSAGSMPGSTPS